MPIVGVFDYNVSTILVFEYYCVKDIFSCLIVIMDCI